MNLIIALRKRAGDKAEIITGIRTIAVGQAQAECLYEEYQADRVALIEVDEKAAMKEDIYNVIYKIERNCKHPKGFQWQFIYENGTIRLKCEDCRVSFGSDLYVNEEDDSTESPCGAQESLSAQELVAV